MINVNGVLNIGAVNPANLSDAGTLLPTDQIVVWRNGEMLRTTVAAFGVEPAPTPIDLTLIALGATEDTDGDYQRFTYDGVSAPIGAPSFVAELDLADYAALPVVKFKLPDLSGGQLIRIYLLDGSTADIGGDPFTINNVALTADFNGEGGAHRMEIAWSVGNAEIDSEAITPVPTVGTEVTVSVLSRSSVLIEFGSESIPITLPADFFGASLNVALLCAIGSAPVSPVSIRVEVL